MGRRLMETIDQLQTRRRFADKKTLAEHYGVSQRTITNWMGAGLLVFIKVRRVVRFEVSACDAALLEYGFIKRV